MPNRSFTFTSNAVLLLLALAAAAAPLLLAENILVPAYSSQQIQMNLVNVAIAQSENRKYLLLGDSTIRNLHPSALQIEADHETVNLGAGGGMAMEWFYSMRNALRVGKNFKAVVAGMSSGESFKTSDSIPPYFPFLLESQDAWNEYRAHHLSLSQSSLLFLYIHLKLPYTRSDVLYGLVSEFLPEMRPFMMNLVVDQVAKAGAPAETPNGPALKKRIWGVEQMLKLASERSLSIRFVLSPMGVKWRKNDFYLSRRKFFFDTCKEMKLQCTDLSAKLPDHFFSDDGIHLKGDYVEVYKRLIEELLARDGQP